MIVSTVIFKWCFAVYMLLEMVLSVPLAPDQYRRLQTGQNNLSNNKRQYCGSDFPSRLNDVCAVFPSYFPSGKVTTTTDAAINTTSNDQISGISASYCCETGCTPKELESFCEVVKKPTTTETNSIIIEEPILKLKNDDLHDDVFVSSTTTDVPHKPEYVYAGNAGEYWDTEPLTLLPTYTSPDYASNLLKL